MSLTAGGRLGSYDIVAPLGAGGMGEVYRATDTRLKRQVAVKILPSALASDPDRLARFQREAEVLASLNHPHIASVYGFEDSGDAKALVMELVEGPTLADRIGQGAVPIDEALPIARQIAEALEAAHERGIIHRDLKPANIKVRDDGAVKVLDFGLAKLVESRTDRTRHETVADSPTLASPAMTEVGMILGTAAYMSPEQARGRTVDKRTDIWAFGAVLYEMLTGTRAFGGSKSDDETVTDLIAAVLTSTPKWSALPATVPLPVVTLIQRCLEKDRNARIGDIAVARFILADHAMLSGAPSAATPVVSAHDTSRRAMLPWVVAVALAVALAATSVAWLRAPRPTGTTPVTRLQMTTAPADFLQSSVQAVWIRPPRTTMTMSPNGRLIVFGGMSGKASQLYSRSLDRAEATPIPGTENGFAPFLSPNGEWIGFFTDGKLKRVPIAGGPAAAICDVAGQVSSASWGENGAIVFSTFTGDHGLFTVSADGGTPTKVGAPDTAKRERFLLPHWLPGGKAFLFTTIASPEWDTANVVVQTVGSTERRVLIQGGADARYVATGHLLFMKSGVLNAVPFDLASQQVRGAAVPLLENVMQSVNTWSSYNEIGAGQFAVSASGTLLYVLGGIHPSRQNTLVWVDRTGKTEPLAGLPTASHLVPRLSPDGQRIILQVRQPMSRGTDLWLYDAARGAPTRLTFNADVSSPIWSPDGQRFVYSDRGLVISRADGGGEVERLTSSDVIQTSTSWGATNVIAFLQRTQSGNSGLWTLSLDGDKKPRLFLETRFRLWHPEISPDGRWMAYVSDESGSPEVYVQAYPGPGQKVRISTAVGFEPIWTRNGQELLYKSQTPDGQQYLSATIRSYVPFRADPPRLIFAARFDEYDTTEPTRSWDVSADGRRFLMLRVVPITDRPVNSMNIVLNWTDELKRLAPAK